LLRRRFRENTVVCLNAYQIHRTAQYHNRIVKKWRIRKNISKKDWHKLFCEDQLRRQSGKSTTFRFNDRLISAETKEREWARYAFSAESEVSGKLSWKSPVISDSLILAGLSPLPDAFEFEDENTPNTSNLDEHDLNGAATLVVTTRSPIQSTIFPSPALDRSSIQPFSWGDRINWKILTQAMGPDKQIIRPWEPDRNRLSAMFYPQYRASKTVVLAGETSSLQHLISSIVNGIGCATTPESTGVYVWLANLPRKHVLDILWSLPDETVDVICQRIRNAAVDDILFDEAKCILVLEQNLRKGRTLTAQEVTGFFRRLSRKIEFAFAEVLVRYAIQSTNDPDLILQQTFDSMILEDPSSRHHLMWASLESGATLTLRCFLEVGDDILSLDRLLLLGHNDILHWVKAGLLDSFMLTYDLLNGAYTKAIAWVLSKLRESIHRRQTEGKWTDDDVFIIHSSLSKAFRTSLIHSMRGYLKIIFEFCCQLSCQPTFSQTDWELDQKVLSACHAGDFSTAIAASQPLHTNPSVVMSMDLRTAILSDDLRRVQMLFFTERSGSLAEEALDVALSAGSDKVAAHITSRELWGPFAITKVLSSGRLRAVDRMIASYSHLDSALQDIHSTGDFTDLEDWMHRKQLHKHCNLFPCTLLEQNMFSLTLFLRVLSYLAIHRHDTKLLDWLCRQGLALESLQVECDDENPLLGVVALQNLSSKLVSQQAGYNFMHVLPSLLEVVAKQKDLVMLQYFISASPPQRNSRALLQAVKAKANMAIDELLRYEERHSMDTKRTQYGSAALRVAIRNHNYTLVKMLAKVTDIHGLEHVDEEKSVLDWLDPLGEAVLRDDLDAVEILLDHGGDPDAVVAFKGLQEHTPGTSNNSVLSRMTPLLVAIDLGSCAMVKLLLKRGASIDRELDMGLLRTPLQRAAEIGDFDIVQYLIEKGAMLDTVPPYGGGTALQLAAMSGHVGIAALLIEHGANVDYLPARGPGRTAFEAAAEWCRPDMMYLLVQRGVRLNLEVVGEFEERYKFDDPKDVDIGIEYRWCTARKVQTQYERAIKFAEERGEYASKRIVQNLWDKFWTQRVHGFPGIEA
jgi:hypothetical protein